MLFNSVAVWIYLKIELWLRKMEKTRLWTRLMVICQPLSTDQWNMWKFIPWIAFLHWNYYNFVCSKKKNKKLCLGYRPFDLWIVFSCTAGGGEGAGIGQFDFAVTRTWKQNCIVMYKSSFFAASELCYIPCMKGSTANSDVATNDNLKHHRRLCDETRRVQVTQRNTKRSVQFQ